MFPVYHITHSLNNNRMQTFREICVNEFCAPYTGVMYTAMCKIECTCFEICGFFFSSPWAGLVWMYIFNKAREYQTFLTKYAMNIHFAHYILLYWRGALYCTATV